MISICLLMQLKAQLLPTTKVRTNSSDSICELIREITVLIKRRREAADTSASMKTFDCYDIVRQFYRAYMASLAWSTSRVGETCCENVWTTARRGHRGDAGDASPHQT